MFLDILSDENISDKGGAGLGLIEMARKTGNNIDFDFEKISEEQSYCYLMFKIKHPDETLDTKTKQIQIDSLKKFHVDISIIRSSDPGFLFKFTPGRSHI